MNENSQTTFRKLGFWEPDTARSVAVRPGQWKHIFRYPISIRFEETTSNRHARSSVGHIRKKHVSVSYLLFLVKAHIDCFLIVGEL